MVFPSPSRQVSSCFKLRHDRFFLFPFEFTIPYRRYVVRGVDIVVK